MNGYDKLIPVILIYITNMRFLFKSSCVIIYLYSNTKQEQQL